MVFGLRTWYSLKTGGKIWGYDKKIEKINAKNNILLYHIKQLLVDIILMNYV